ncbi:MAG: hypothetical protein U9O98_10015 [Asgard group archaeon]|nr:hypothetical protein [Asgard group archaeon]
MSKFIEKFKLYFKLLFLNRKNSIVMFLGLGLSLALIAESLMFMYSFQYGAFEDFMGGAPTQQFTITASDYDISTVENAGIPELNSLTEDAIEESNMEERISNTDWFLGKGLFTVAKIKSSGSETILSPFNMYAVPPDYFSSFEKILYNGTLPQKIKDCIVVAKTSSFNRYNLSQLGTFTFYTPVWGMQPAEVVNSDNPSLYATINTSGIIKKEDFENVRGILENNFEAMTNYFSEEFLITTYTNMSIY